MTSSEHLQIISREPVRTVNNRRSSNPEHRGTRPVTVLKERLTFVDIREGKIYSRDIKYHRGDTSVPYILYKHQWVLVNFLKWKKV